MVVPASHLGGMVPSGGPCTQICSDLLSCFWLGTIARQKRLLGIREAGINNHENQLFREGGDSLQMSSCQDDVERRLRHTGVSRLAGRCMARTQHPLCSLRPSPLLQGIGTGSVPWHPRGSLVTAPAIVNSRSA